MCSKQPRNHSKKLPTEIREVIVHGFYSFAQVFILLWDNAIRQFTISDRDTLDWFGLTSGQFKLLGGQDNSALGKN